MAQDTIALIATYIHPSQDSIEQMVRTAFPEYRVEKISILDLVKARKRWIAPNLLSVAREYGSNVLRGVVPLRTRYFQTTYLFGKIRAEMRRRIDPRRHVFSFQAQSQYDTSVPGVPHFIYTDHTHLSNLASPYFDRRLLRPRKWIALERTIYENAARVFTRSSDVTADVIAHYGIAPAKVACVYTGSNVRVPADLAMDNASYANRNILFVGGDWERKGGPTLVAAFRQVLRTYPDAHLTIAGANPVLDVANCTVLGHVPLADLSRHYARASVFCLPTRLEPFGIAFLEAMMHRLPVIGTRVGAVPDFVQDGSTGRLVDPGAAEQLADALLEILGDPDKARRFGEAGFQRTVGTYTWERVGQRIRAAVLPVIR